MKTFAQNLSINTMADGELRNELGRKNFFRAAELAASLSVDELRRIHLEALWQIASERNAPGTKQLATQYGIRTQD
jgi:hypothetical protein